MTIKALYLPSPTGPPPFEELVLECDRQKYWVKKTSRLKKLLGYAVKEQHHYLGDLSNEKSEKVILSCLIASWPNAFMPASKVLDIGSEQLILAKLLAPDCLYACLNSKIVQFYRQHESEYRGGAHILAFDWTSESGQIPFPTESFDLVLTPYFATSKTDLTLEIARVLKARGQLILKGTAHLLTKREIESLNEHFKLIELLHLSYETSEWPALEKKDFAWKRYLVYAWGKKR